MGVSSRGVVWSMRKPTSRRLARGMGMLVVGIPYSSEGLAHTAARGASPYGASTIAGQRGELSPAPEDLEFARVLLIAQGIEGYETHIVHVLGSRCTGGVKMEI